MGITALRLNAERAAQAKATPARAPTLSELPREALEALARERGESIRKLSDELASVRGDLEQATRDLSAARAEAAAARAELEQASAPPQHKRR